ncbi:hypothetical protein [Lactiplantibacillus modestisalitolerans]|uniref:Uncharacterized protein n=1 Tax=Lactiplantibacillus modestisalitolerans TaxID=1457219 RepID=A0ABV5WVW1_9LACO|nr:hypothetical protein [Lactiplantibacillus modestisalitolerans]
MAKTTNIQVNCLDMELDKTGLNSKFDVYKIVLTQQEYFSDFYRQLQASPALSMVYKNKLNYYVLFSKRASVKLQTCDQFTVTMVPFSDLNPNQVVQLLLNQLTNLTLAPERNLTPELYVTLPKWQRNRRLGGQIRYALKVKLTWHNELVLSVTSFRTPSEHEKLPTERYQYCEKRGLMVRQFDSKEPYWIRGNKTKINNTVDFLNTDQLERFERSKVGIVTQLQHELKRNFGKCFKKETVTFANYPVLKVARPKPSLKSEHGASIWRYFKDQTINVISEPTEPKTGELATQIALALTKSPLLQELKLVIQQREHLVDGLNLSVIREARPEKVGKANVIETYQRGTETQIIQHLTIENVGHYSLDSDLTSWQPKQGEVTIDPAMVNIFQNLAVKADIRAGQLRLVDNELIETTSRYQYYWFNSLKTGRQDPCRIAVVKATVTATGQLAFSDQVVTLSDTGEFKRDELTELCYLIWDNLNHHKWLWALVDGVICSQDSYLLIMQTQLQLMPKSEELMERHQRADGSRVLVRSVVLSDLALVATSPVGKISADDYQAAIAAFRDVIEQIPDPTFTVDEVRQRLKKHANRFFSNRAVQQVCRNFEQVTDYTFNNSARQTQPYSLFPGFRDIGLIQIKQDHQWVYHYYVGTNAPLPQTVSRAIRLRALIPLPSQTSKDAPDEVVNRVFPDLINLMGVEFVRNGQWTVKPFMMKYAREYWRLKTYDPQKKDSK